MTSDTPARSSVAQAEPVQAERVSTGLLGLHHVAVVSRDVERASDFYSRVLGLRELGGGTAPPPATELDGGFRELPARFFGEQGGRPGGIIAMVERPGAASGYPGIGATHHFALCVENREVLLMWKRRMLDEGIAVNGILDRHYFQSIYVKDPDGTIVELATFGPGWAMDEPADRIGEEHRAPPPEMVNTNRDRARIAAENWPEAVTEITPGMRIQGLHHVTAIGVDIEATHAFLAARLGMRRVKRTNNFDDAGSFHWYWGVGDGRPGTLVTYFERSPERERPAEMGAGQVSHYAMAVETGAIDDVREALASAGLPVTASAEYGPDRARFNASSTRDPDGQLVLLCAVTGATSYGAGGGERR